MALYHCRMRNSRFSLWMLAMSETGCSNFTRIAGRSFATAGRQNTGLRLDVSGTTPGQKRGEACKSAIPKTHQISKAVQNPTAVQKRVRKLHLLMAPPLGYGSGSLFQNMCNSNIVKIVEPKLAILWVLRHV